MNKWGSKNRPLYRLILCGLVLFSAPKGYATERPTFILAAANSTCNMVRALGEQFSRGRDISMEYICKSSGRLAKGMMGAAIKPDYYVSANRSWMDKVVDRGIIRSSAVSAPWSNRLVVAVPALSGVVLDGLEDLKGEAVASIMIGDPSTAPFGRYAKQALAASNVWGSVRDKITTRKHTTMLANNLAEAPVGAVGILFSTSITASLKMVLVIPESLHQPIRYYAAPVAGSALSDHALAFSQFLKSQEAITLADNRGFITNP